MGAGGGPALTVPKASVLTTVLVFTVHSTRRFFLRRPSFWKPATTSCTRPPSSFSDAKDPNRREHSAKLVTLVALVCDNQFIQDVTCDEELDQLVCVSSAFVAHTAQKSRVVYDYTHPNDFQDASSCKYETLPDLAQSLRPGDALLTWDVKDAYHHLRIRPEDRKFLAFRCLGRVFVPLTMPFGLRIAPYTWTKVMRPVVQYLRERGFRILAYVDDFGGAPPAPPGVPAIKAQAQAAYRFITKLFGELGLKLHPTKGVSDGPTRVRLLGHMLDTKLARFLLPEDRVDKVVAMAVTLSRHATQHRRWVSFKILRRMCGTAVSTTLSVPPARYHLRSLFTALKCRHPRSGDVRLGHQAVKDLMWWTDLRTNAATGRAIWPGAASILLDTDASGSGWGAVLNEGEEARGYHGVDRNGLHINCLELGAVTRALQSFKHLIPSGSIIRLRTDSMVALHVMRASSSRSPALMAEMRNLYELCQDMNVELRVEHVSSVLNDWADRLSRENNSTDWTLSRPTFLELERAYGPHTVDLFASTLNARCPRFYSRWLCSGALGTDAMQHDWTAENAWANPPFHMVGSVVSRILNTNATVTLIAPVWRAQPWWRRVVEGCSEWHILPPPPGVFTHDSQSRPAASPFWRTAAFRFERTNSSVTTANGGRC